MISGHDKCNLKLFLFIAMMTSVIFKVSKFCDPLMMQTPIFLIFKRDITKEATQQLTK